MQEDVARISKRHRSKLDHKANGHTSHAAEDEEYGQPSNYLVVHPQKTGVPIPLEDAGSQDGQVESSVEQSSTCKVSKPMGGRMLDMDPIFSPDERSVVPRLLFASGTWNMDAELEPLQDI